jgi:phosphatidylethanolamine-binding protein (PEBP) family uncharacterized protein
MAASLYVPEHWVAADLPALSTIPEEWRPGDPAEAATLHGVAVSRKQKRGR